MRPCLHCGSVERAANGQCRCRVRAYNLRRRGKVPKTARRGDDPETGVVTVSASKAASFLAWVPSSEIPRVSVEVLARDGRCALVVNPAVAWNLWAARRADR